MRSKRKRRFVIPSLVEHEGQMVPISDFPEFTVFSDKELGKALDVSTLTIRKWKQGKIIPFIQSHGYFKYNVNDVVNSLKAFGYCQATTGGQPTGHNR